jgi:hypothetical protein
VIDVHAALTLRAAHVAASALQAIATLRPILGQPNGETHGFAEVLESLRALYAPPKPRVPRPRRAPALARAPKPKTIRKPKPRRAEPVELEVAPSAWDPEPRYEASHCKALLMEIILRAAHDYVLYRQHRKRDLKALAEQAYTWLFEEEPGHPAWTSRERALFQIETEEGQTQVEVGSRRLTSFLSICEICGLDPDDVRQRAREMTVESIMRTGRHIERRKSRPNSEMMSVEMHSVVGGIDIESLDAENQTSSSDYYDSRNSYGVDSPW